MNSILTTALLITTAFATPLSLQTRQDPPGDGVDSGIQVSMYEKADCQGDGLIGQEMFYNAEYAQQMQSYTLSDDIGADDVLTIWADTSWTPTGSKGVESSLNGDTSAACAQFAYNLVGNDVLSQKKKCHKLPNVVGCMTIMINQTHSG